MSHLPLNALRVFEAVARNESFRLASEELFVSQSAISHQIKHLEAWFGMPLFDRSGNRPKLLPHGETLARELLVSFSDLSNACQRARRSTAPQTLVLAAIPSIAICWLIPKLASFRAEHPEIALRVIYAFHGQAIDFNDVDLAFVYAKAPPTKPQVRSIEFLPGDSVPVCSPTLHQAMDLAPLCECILQAGLLHDSDISGWTQWFSQAKHTISAGLSGPILEDFNLLRAATLAGQGVALSPLSMIRDDLSAGRLVQLSDTAIYKELSYYLLIQNTHNPGTELASRAFEEWLYRARDAVSVSQL